jgi:alginate O-acetyltransferase complex protein AlgI
MNFASWSFVGLFLPATLAIFLLLRGPDASLRRQHFLTAVSFVFYAFSGLGNLAILLCSVAVNFAAGKALTSQDESRTRRRVILWSAIGFDLALLLSFKIIAYSGSVATGFSSQDEILIPLALSFITFQKIGFVASCYRRTIKQISLPDYLFFAAFFPQLMMGPIVRFEDIGKQLKDRVLSSVTASDIGVGLSIFALGLAKKLMIADRLASPVDLIFDTAQHSAISTFDAWYAIIAFQLQIFFDFTAYAEMSIGLGRMFGMRMPINFDRPLFAINRFDLWRRWHISFVVFMRSNVFMPLVRHWKFPVPLALAVTGMLSGLWHGLGWTFIFWGVLQTTVLLAVHLRNTRWRRESPPQGLHRVWLVLSTFIITCLIGALFRSPTLESTSHVYLALMPLRVGDFPSASLLAWRTIGFCIIAAAIAWVLPDLSQIFRDYWTAIDMRADGKPPPVHPLERWIGFRLSLPWGFFIAAILIIALVQGSEAKRFVYAQF